MTSLTTTPTTTRRTSSLLGVFAATLAASLFAFTQTASAGAFMPDSAESPVASKVNLLYLLIFVLGVIALIAVIGSIMRAIRSEASPESVKSGSVKSGSVKSTVYGAAVVAITFAVLGSYVLSETTAAEPSNSGVGSQFKPTAYSDPSLKVANEVDPPEGPSITVRVNGQQFLWRYSYPGFNDGYSYQTLVIPVGVTTLLDVTSSDVEHGWWVPQLGGTIDALPGYINKGWIRADKPGTYEGASTVISGTNYASMTTRVVALPPAKFLAWVKGKNLEITAAMNALADEVASGKEQALTTGEAAK